jgi:hypothetical protein
MVPTKTVKTKYRYGNKECYIVDRKCWINLAVNFTGLLLFQLKRIGGQRA